MTDVSLPDWLLAELPPVRPHGRAEADGARAVVYLPPDGLSETFESVPMAYEALREVDLEFSDVLTEREGAIGRMINFPADNGRYVTAWLERNDTLSLQRLQQQYRESLARAEEYHAAGAPDFLAAFGYLDSHPAFWIRRHSDCERARWFWETHGHMNRVHVEVWRGDDGGVKIGLETGMHTPDMTELFYDPYLDAVGDTFEAAVLELARNVSVSFRDDGTETGQKLPNPEADRLSETIRERASDGGRRDFGQ